jgi:nucleotide-binding universal stress UspA family protein
MAAKRRWRSVVDTSAMTGIADLTGTPIARSAVFDRVIVGVDGSEAGYEACRQAKVLAPRDAPIEVVSVVHLADAVRTGLSAPRVADQLQREAEATLNRAAEILGDRARTRFVNGLATDALLREVERVDATALAIGTHGHRRATEIMIGGVAGELLHRAPCSVLLARAPTDATAFPGALVVGIDGSPASEAALAAAQDLALRFGARLRIVVASRGKNVDLDRVSLRAPLAERVDEHPVKALVEASRSADLVVVGSRGLHGLRALGSVSERVAHQAACSVLVTRVAPEA